MTKLNPYYKLNELNNPCTRVPKTTRRCNMRKYEVVLMFYPDVEEETRVKTFDRLKNIIETHGKIESVDEWGMRKLAYEIEYYTEAYYVLVNFEAEPATVKEFDRVAKILDPVMRHMVVAIEK